MAFLSHLKLFKTYFGKKKKKKIGVFLFHHLTPTIESICLVNLTLEPLRVNIAY
jgi:hypothetical protein